MLTGKKSIEHVLIVVQNLPVPLDRRVWLECQALTAAGYRVSVICPKGPGDPSRQEIAGVRIYKYRPAREAKGVLGFVWEFVYSWVRTALLSLVVWGKEPFQVLQACNPPDTYWALARLWSSRGVRFVFDQHDLNPELFLSRFGEPSGLAQRVQYQGLLWLERMTYRQADHVLSTNESYRAIAQRRGGKAAEDVTVVRSGPDTRRMRPIRPRGSGWRGGRTLLVYLGVMGPQDNVDVLLEVMDDLVHRRGRDDVRLALLGFGDCLEDLKAECATRGLEDHVLFTGRVGPAEIAEYLSSADIGLSPDRRTPLNDASTMNKAMEYMAYGLPAVSFDLTETRVSAGSSALYAPDGDVTAFADAVVTLVDDPDLRVRMGELARTRVVADLDWRPQASAYVGAFDRVSGHERTEPLPDLLPALTSSVSVHYVDDTDPLAFGRFLRERGRISRAHDLIA